MLSITMDITPRKMAENELIWERNHLRTLLEFYRRPDTQVHDIITFVVEQCVRISESPLGVFRVHQRRRNAHDSPSLV